MPTDLAIATAVQCVASPGGSFPVSAMTRSITVVANGGLPEGRVFVAQEPVHAFPHEALLPAPHTGLVLAGPALDAGRDDTIGCQ